MLQCSRSDGSLAVRRATACVAICLALTVMLAGTARAQASGAARSARPVTRIVTLSPHAAELVFAAGAGALLVGTVEGSDHPPSALAVPRIGAIDGLARERLLAARPDLVITWASGNPRGLGDWLAQQGIAVLDSDPKAPAAIAQDLRRIGAMAGTQAIAEVAARTFEGRLEHLRARHAGLAPVRVFHQVWTSPLMSVGRDSIVAAVIALCGGVSVPEAPARPAWVVSREAVLAADPQLILDSPPAGMSDDRSWQRHAWLAAVKAGQVQRIDPDLLHRPGPRLVEGAAQVCERIEAARVAHGLADAGESRRHDARPGDPARHAMVRPHGS
jgi:iron complex transport system substrate-binding protein